MKKSILTALGCLLLAAVFPIAAFAQELIVGGQAIGIRIQTEGVLVSGVGEVETAEGSRRPAADAGLQEGDRILQANGRELHSAAELIAAVGEAEGRTVELTIRREEKELLVFVQPALSKDGQWMMGLWLRDVVTGTDDNEQIEILSGLEPGEVVVVESFEGLTDGTKVEVTLEGDEGR